MKYPWRIIAAKTTADGALDRRIIIVEAESIEGAIKRARERYPLWEPVEARPATALDLKPAGH